MSQSRQFPEPLRCPNLVTGLGAGWGVGLVLAPGPVEAESAVDKELAAEGVDGEANGDAR